ANDASTGVCCAIENANCTAIFTIDCDVQLQNAANNPGALLFTTLLDGQLARCGNGCCPFGFYCHYSNEEAAWHCLMATDYSSINKTAGELARISKADPKAYVAPEETNMMSFHPPALIPTLTSGDGTSTYQMNTTSASNQDLPVSTVAGIAVGSVAGLALIATAAAFVVRRRKKQNKAATGELDIKPYQYSSNQPNGGAVNLGAEQVVINRDVGCHVGKEGLPIQSPDLTSIMERDRQPFQSLVQSPPQSPRLNNAGKAAPRQTVFELA
ncbi:MAG: hypothetical protein M1823_006465, partial [Watsoniomyces obsoletus]